MWVYYDPKFKYHTGTFKRSDRYAWGPQKLSLPLSQSTKQYGIVK